MSANDSIVAAATPAGESALAVVRVSGTLCSSLVESALGVSSPTPRRAYLSGYRDLENALLDEVIFIFYDEGKSYTGETSLEISSHGNSLITKKIIEDLIVRGCRLAEPGEFTRRAFLAGRMDLTQAESVATLIRARSDRALEAARLQLRGALGKKVSHLQSRLLNLRASLEAYVDFPEEDLPAENLQGPASTLKTLIDDMARLRAGASYGRLLESGVRCLIVGAPNAGKSSLFNSLCGDDRAIVSEEAGTTRDYLSSWVEIGSFEVEVIDTAGLREGGSDIERQGIEKTFALAEDADCFLYVLDSTLPSPSVANDLLPPRFTPSNCLVLENKTDLQDSKEIPDFLPDCIHLRLSLLMNKGLPECLSALEKMVEKLAPSPSEDGVIVNTRHAECLETTETALCEARRLILDEGTVELALSEVLVAQEALGDIVGKTDNEDMLDRLFQSFCIGK